MKVYRKRPLSDVFCDLLSFSPTTGEDEKALFHSLPKVFIQVIIVYSTLVVAKHRSCIHYFDAAYWRSNSEVKFDFSGFNFNKQNGKFQRKQL